MAIVPRFGFSQSPSVIVNNVFTPMTAYNGPIRSLDWEYANITPTNLNIAPTGPNVFIHTGSGNDSINVSGFGGDNVLDGGSGSNFLVGGFGRNDGRDQFYVDQRGTVANTWTTIQNFGRGDSVTVWGITPNDFQITRLNNQGAPNARGLTFSITAAGKPTVDVTIAGYSTIDINRRVLEVTFGHTADQPGLRGNDYMLIRG